MIALIGAGNVATWVTQRLEGTNDERLRISQIYSRHIENAYKLADFSGAQAIDDLAHLNRHADIYLFALKDDAYVTALEQIPFVMPVAIHMAGTVSQKILAPYAQQFGVLYPLQTFTKSMEMNGVKVPLCMETNQLDTAEFLVQRLAEELSDERYAISEEQRMVLHLAAVFACNFSNAMCAVAADILQDNGMDFQMLLPILKQTVSKLEGMSPLEAQTGPAVRHDQSVMDKHLTRLKGNEKKIYELISQRIMQQSK